MERKCPWRKLETHVDTLDRSLTASSILDTQAHDSEKMFIGSETLSFPSMFCNNVFVTFVMLYFSKSYFIMHLGRTLTL